MAYLNKGMIIPEKKKEEDFQSMNCNGCMCNNCNSVCSNCVQCYRADYAEEGWEDYY